MMTPDSNSSMNYAIVLDQMLREHQEKLNTLGLIASDMAERLLHLSVWVRNLEKQLPEGSQAHRDAGDLVEFVEGTYFQRTTRPGLMDLMHLLQDQLPAFEVVAIAVLEDDVAEGALDGLETLEDLARRFPGAVAL